VDVAAADAASLDGNEHFVLGQSRGRDFFIREAFVFFEDERLHSGE
jgi:hypothetical protein